MSKAPSTTTPEQDMEQTRKLTQISGGVKLYEQEATLGLIMRPVRTIIDTSEIKKAFRFATDSVNLTTPPKADQGENGSQTKKTVDVTSAKRAEEAIAQTGNILRANLIAETDIRNKQVSTVDEYGPFIAMPLPEKIKDSLRVSYSTSDLGFGAVSLLFGQDVAISNKDGSSVADSAINSASYVIRTLLASLPGGIGGLSQKLAGSIPNPFSAAIFEKVTPRKFNFNWTIQPQSPKESNNLRDVINHLRYWSLPNPSTQRLILEVPYEWELSFVGTNFLYSFSRCVMSNIDIDYSPNGFNSFMVGGAPQSVTISIEFEEVFPLDKSTIDGGGAGSESMKPSSTTTRPPEPTPSESEVTEIEQTAVKNLTTADTELTTAKRARTEAEVAYQAALKKFDGLGGQTALGQAATSGRGGTAVINAKNELNASTKTYDSAIKNEQDAYNEYQSKLNEFTITGKSIDPAKEQSAPAPRKP
jgi:hypothetical protein